MYMKKKQRVLKNVFLEIIFNFKVREACWNWHAKSWIDTNFISYCWIKTTYMVVYFFPRFEKAAETAHSCYCLGTGVITWSTLPTDIRMVIHNERVPIIYPYVYTHMPACVWMRVASKNITFFRANRHDSFVQRTSTFTQQQGVEMHTVKSFYYYVCMAIVAWLIYCQIWRTIDTGETVQSTLRTYVHTPGPGSQSAEQKICVIKLNDNVWISELYV